MKCMNCGNTTIDPLAQPLPVEVKRGMLSHRIPGNDKMGIGIASMWVEGFPCGVPDCGGYMVPEDEIPEHSIQGRLNRE